MGQTLRCKAGLTWVWSGIVALTLLAWPAPAKADFRVCNATPNLVGVAIGYRSESGWISEGWWSIEGTKCQVLIRGPLNSRYYYIYAEAVSGARWMGNISMCIADNEFRIIGVNDCLARGFKRAEFAEYDTGSQSSWMVQLTGNEEQ